MENQHRQIKGYRDFTQEELDAINEIKAGAEKIDALCSKIRSLPGVDQRWHSIGVTDLQKGFMALTRSVARPTSF